MSVSVKLSWTQRIGDLETTRQASVPWSAVVRHESREEHLSWVLPWVEYGIDPRTVRREGVPDTEDAG